MFRKLTPYILCAIVVLSCNIRAFDIAWAQQAPRFGQCDNSSGALYEGAVTRSLLITMRDGVRLAADAMLPENLPAGKKIPTVLTLTRYWRAVENGQPNPAQRFFTSHGYAVVTVDVRGTGASFGRWLHPWSSVEIKDTADIINWIVAQPWSDGQIGTIGTSYTANTAELAAVVNHPAVKAVIPRHSDFDIYKDLTFPGGIMFEYLVREWGHFVYALDNNVKNGQPPAGVRPVDEDRDGRLLQGAVRDHAKNPLVYDSFKQITYRDDQASEWGVSVDEFSLHRFRKEIEQSKVGIYAWGSWLDAGTSEGVLAQFMTFGNPQRAVIGPWSHGAAHHASPFLPQQTATDPNPQIQLREALCYFDQYLKGVANGMAEKVLIYYTLGEEKWKTTRVWPPPGSTSERFYLAEHNSLSRKEPVTSSGNDKYTVDFAATTGTTNRWYTQLTGADVVYPNRAEDDRRLLVYTSEPLTKDMEITGHPVVTLYVTSTATDGAFYVYLEDVDENGRVTYVTEGQLRALHRRLSLDPPPYKSLMPYYSFKRQDAMPLIPGEVAKLKFGLWPTSVLIKKGHRIRIALAGADKDTFLRIPAEGTPVITLARNRRHASFLELPIMRRRY